MSTLNVDLFVEDRAHAAFLCPLSKRIAVELGHALDVSERLARGGRSRVLAELDIYQTAVARGGLRTPDLVIVGVDTNCRGQKARREIEGKLIDPVRERAVLACPEPHIERWYIDDAEGFETIVGAKPAIRRPKCSRGEYKTRLMEAIRKGGHPAPLGGLEFADDLANGIDLYRAGRADGTLKHFVRDLRRFIRQYAGT